MALAASSSRLMMRGGHHLRLRRPLLTQKNAEDDDYGGRQKLALPILEKFKPELRTGQILKRRERLCAMVSCLFGCFLRAVEPMHQEGRGEEQQQYDTQRVVICPPSQIPPV